MTNDELMTEKAGSIASFRSSALRASSFGFVSGSLIRISSFAWQICQDGGGAEDIYEGDFKEEDPTQSHQLIIAETRESEADPDENEKEGRDFGEENKNVNEAENPAVRTVRDTWKMPAAQKKSDDNGRPGDHGGVFAEEKESELHRAVFGVITADQLRFRFG